MRGRINSFLTADQGAITVDWVVLCALCAGLAISAARAVQESSEPLGAQIRTAVDVSADDHDAVEE
ncbi:MAG: hypothetical protein HLUCCA12_01625 [Rhodobacteraceae bacterium HLUCCA12]|nr:MAG: hypothetical protein HLUCCA12_01625 [Rhodobacteraceae bacterium HLUCCA12]